MATSNRDVKLTLSVDTLGEEGVKSLQSSVQALAREGGSAAPEFQKLADQVALLAGEGKETEAALKAIAAAADGLNAQLRELEATTDAQRAAETEATMAVRAAGKALNEQRDARALLRAEAKAGNVDTEKFKADELALTRGIVEGAAALRQKKDAQASAATAARVASAAEQALANDVKAANAANAAAIAVSNAAAKAAKAQADAAAELNRELTLSERAAKLFSGAMGQITAGNVAADAVGYVVNKVKEMGSAFIDSVVQLDQMRRGLNAIYQSATTTASQINFLRRTASDAGVSFGGLSQEFVKFSAATNGANIPLSQSNALFQAVVRSSATLGLSAEDTAGSLNALGQMASKGTVSMEELRQQLGDRLPGALGLAAKGLGLTESELIKLVETGKLATRDFIVPFTAALNTMQGETDGLVPTFERFKGALTETAQGIGDAGALQILIALLKTLGGLVGTVALGASALAEAVGLVARGFGTLVGAVVTLTNPLSELTALFKQSVDRLTGQANALNAAIDGTDSLAAAQTQLASVTAFTLSSTNGLTAAQQLQAYAVKLAGDATLDASAKHVQFGKTAAQVQTALEQEIVSLEKYAKAAKIQGDAMVNTAKLRGGEFELIKAQIAASELEVAAQEKLLAVKRGVTDVLQIEFDEMIRNGQARGDSVDKIAAESAALKQKLDASKAEVEQAKQITDALINERLQRRLSADTYADHADKVALYTAALARANAEQSLVEGLARQGLATDERVRASTEALTIAKVRLNDAIKDRQAREDRLVQQIATTNNVEQAGLSLQMAKLKAAESKAIFDGNDYELQKSLLAQKDLEITMLNLSVAGKIAESNAQIAALRLKQAELDLGDPLYAQRAAAYDLSIKAAEAAILEAKARGENVAALERERDALKNGTAARTDHTAGLREEIGYRQTATSAANAQSDAIEKLNMRYTLSADYSRRQVDLLQQEIEWNEKLVAAENKRLNRDKEGFSLNTNGDRVNMAVPTKKGVYEQAKSAGLDEKTAVTLADRFITDQGAQTGYGGINAQAGETWFTAVQKAIDQAVLNAARTSSATSGTATATPSTVPSSTKTVNVVINGKSTAINVASASDSDALTSVIRQLETAARGTA